MKLNEELNIYKLVNVAACGFLEQLNQIILSQSGLPDGIFSKPKIPL
jgi:hypothetical protein